MGDHPVHCRVFTSIPGLSSLDASSSPPLGQSWQPKMSPDIAKHLLAPGVGVEEQNHPQLRTMAVE